MRAFKLFETFHFNQFRLRTGTFDKPVSCFVRFPLRTNNTMHQKNAELLIGQVLVTVDPV